MGSSYVVFLRNKDNVPVAMLDDQRDSFCYAKVKTYLWYAATARAWRGEPRVPYLNLKKSWGVQHPGFQKHYRRYLDRQGDPLDINLAAVCMDKFRSDATYSVPVEQQLVRVYFQRQYRYKNAQHKPLQPLPLVDDEFSVAGYINPRVVGQYFKDTLRMIPELQKYIGPNDDPFSIDVLLGRNHIRQSLLLLWLVRRLDEDPNGYTVPNIVITARALASIAPGLAYYYLLTLEAVWLDGIRDPLYGNIGYDVLPIDENNPWHKNINLSVSFKRGRIGWSPHCLNAFKSTYDREPSLHLTHIKSIITKGVLPNTIGDRKYFKRMAKGTLEVGDNHYEMVQKITCHRGLKRSPKGYDRNDKMDVFHFGLFPDQVEQAYHEIRDHGCIKNAEILDQLNNVIQTLARKPINYFIKGWKADA